MGKVRASAPAAVLAVGKAIKNGVLIRSVACERCGKEGNLYAHHYKGYTREHYLTVQWLCPQCHRKEHRDNKDLDTRQDRPPLSFRLEVKFIEQIKAIATEEHRSIANLLQKWCLERLKTETDRRRRESYRHRRDDGQ
jgi:hypothetical protein